MAHLNINDVKSQRQQSLQFLASNPYVKKAALMSEKAYFLIFDRITSTSIFPVNKRKLEFKIKEPRMIKPSRLIGFRIQNPQATRNLRSSQRKNFFKDQEINLPMHLLQNPSKFQFQTLRYLLLLFQMQECDQVYIKFMLVLQFLKLCSPFYRKHFFQIYNTLEFSMNFSVSKEELIRIVSSCQQRSYDQQIQLLKERGDSVEWLFDALSIDHKNGISNDQSLKAQRKGAYGSNQKQVREPAGLCQLFCDALKDFLLRILIGAGCLSIALHTIVADKDHKSSAWIEGFAILVAVFVCAVVTAVNDYQKERQFMSLNSVADEKKKVTVRRDGIVMELHQDFVLVGDVVSISEGMEIPADGILIQASQVTTDQSAMTGEVDPIKKNLLKDCISKSIELEKNGEKNISDKHQIPSPIIMSGTKILSGQGKMIVLVVGQMSCIGKIRALLQQEESVPTPLQEKLQKLANDIGKYGLLSAIIILVVLLIRFINAKASAQPKWQWDNKKDFEKLLHYLVIAITVIVVAIPEGLPLSVTMSLAFSVKKMLLDQNLVRKMEACQTMGGANNICSDKTGTLTMNKMTLTQIWNVQTKFIETYKETLPQSDLSTNKQYLQLFKIAALVNSTAIRHPEEKGSSTELAILKYFAKLGSDQQDYRKKYEIKVKFPFSSSRKRMSIVLNYQQSAHLFIKGASEIILKSCTSWFNNQTDEIEPITPQIAQKLNQVIVKMAQNSLRTLCLGYKKLSANDSLQSKDQKGVFACEKENIILLAIIGVKDIPRKEVPGAIIKCNRAGITVRMVTGDNIITAKAIAKEIGLTKEGEDFIAMQGPDFIKLVGGVVCKKCRTAICDCPTNSKKAQQTGVEPRVDTIANAQEFDKIKDKLLVLARSRPEDKYCLVTGLKERGNVVAVTGDGTNDAPALKKADVGFAMGNSGTQVARQAAAIILVDDNFNSIVKAVLWGRNIYDSIRKFLQFQLTVNVVAVACTLVGASLLQQEILKPIQMLWVNLIMDTFASLALATEDPQQSLLERGPHPRDEYIISKTMKKHIIAQSIFQFTVMMILVFYGEFFIPEYVDSLDNTTFKGIPQFKWHKGVVGGTVRSGRNYYITGGSDYYDIFKLTKCSSRHFTFIFNVFVMMQVFNFINARKLHQQINIFSGITKSSTFVFVIIGILIMQIIIVTFTGKFFGVYDHFGLTIQQWLICIAIGSISWIINLVIKLIPFFPNDHENEPKEVKGNQTTSLRKRSVLSLKRIQERVERDLAKNHPLD